MNGTLTNSTIYSNEWVFLISPVFVISLHVTNFFLGFPLNVYIIILYFPSRGVMDGSDVFSWNQAVVEMFFVLLGLFECLFSLKLCFLEALGFLLGATFSSRCLFQCCVCLERYLAVVHPITFLRYKPLRYRAACSLVTWMCALANGVVGFCTFPYMPYHVFSALYLLVFTVEVFCCVSILRRLKDPGPRGRESEEKKISEAKKKAFQVVSVNLLLFLIQTIPTAVVFSLYNMLSMYDFTMAVVIFLAVNTATGFLQPVFVLHKAGILSGVWALMKGTSFLTCCLRCGTKKSTPISKS